MRLPVLFEVPATFIHTSGVLLSLHIHKANDKLLTCYFLNYKLNPV